MKCIIFRCSRKQEMYLYLPYSDNENEVCKELDESLLALTGELVKVMDLDLTPERKLARADINDVKEALKSKGYYLQMPPNNIIKNDDSMLHNPDDSF